MGVRWTVAAWVGLATQICARHETSWYDFFMSKVGSIELRSNNYRYTLRRVCWCAVNYTHLDVQLLDDLTIAWSIIVRVLLRQIKFVSTWALVEDWGVNVDNKEALTEHRFGGWQVVFNSAQRRLFHAQSPSANSACSASRNAALLLLVLLSSRRLLHLILRQQRIYVCKKGTNTSWIPNTRHSIVYRPIIQRRYTSNNAY